MTTGNNSGSNIPAADPETQYGIHVVRLDGSLTNAATARLEGAAFVAGDVGNTFSIGAGSAFPEYVSYSVQWLGDTADNATLEWNDLVYIAGLGGGSAGYAKASLPSLSEAGDGSRQDAPIAWTAQPGAFVEIRFKVVE